MLFATNEVYSLKLSNGDEIIAAVANYSESDTLTLKAPLLVMFTGQGIQLMPAMFTIDPVGKIEVNKSMIVAKGTPRTEILDHYLQATSGIALPPGGGSKSLIMG